MKNISNLIVGEEKICNALGISTRLDNIMVSYSHQTGRVTSKWVLTIGKQDSVIRWLLIAPPNDKVKRAKAAKWLKEKKERVAVIRKQLEKKGLL